MLLGRNNFGHYMAHIQPSSFQSKRKFKKELKRICGRKYPISFKSMMKSFNKYGEVLVLINSRGTRMLEKSSMLEGYCDIQDHFHYRICRDSENISVQQQSFRMMRTRYNDDWKMKEPK